MCAGRLSQLWGPALLSWGRCCQTLSPHTAPLRPEGRCVRRETLTALGPSFIKLGQVLSDLVPSHSPSAS